MRIYLDKQIISHLFNRKTEEYTQLLNKIYKSKKHITYCYSPAHLLDLQNDLTPIKHEELKFLETITDNNFISYDESKNITSCYLAKPYEAFEDLPEPLSEINITNLFDINDDEFASENEKQIFNKIKSLVLDFKYDLSSIVKLEDLPKEYKELFSKMFPSLKNEVSFIELCENFQNLLMILQQDKTVYKTLRNLVDPSVDKTQFLIDFKKIDFKNDSNNLTLKKEFIDFVKGTLSDEKKKSRYDFFATAYFSLDLLGISKDPSKTVKFKNMTNDALHSYYGAYCDIIVSDDEGFLKKSKALYKLLDIDTEILTLDEFVKRFTFIIDNSETDFDMFSSLLKHDLTNSIIIKSKPSLKFNRNTTTVKPNHNYFGHFNRIDNSVEDGISYLYFYREIRNYSNFMFYHEFELIINNAIKIFGIDSKMKGDFDWDVETKEIAIGSWKGRRWQYHNFSILIEINEGTDAIGMLFNFNPNQAI